MSTRALNYYLNKTLRNELFRAMASNEDNKVIVIQNNIRWIADNFSAISNILEIYPKDEKMELKLAKIKRAYKW